MDVLDTQIYLAKAYIDMGDLEAAKDIAEKVLLEGNEEQKAIAQELINSLS
jgi:pilus assembly protein FimV